VILPHVNSIAADVSGEEAAYACDDVLLLIACEFWIDGECDGFARGLFSDGKISSFVAEKREALLHVKRHRVVNRSADLIGAQVSHKRITDVGGDADDELVEDVAAILANERERDVIE